jgi:TRAP transporter TAXI family solute receptor
MTLPRRSLHRVFALAAFVLLAACERGPAPDQLRGDLTARIEADLAPGLFEVVDLTRGEAQGLARFDSERRVVPFQIHLRLRRDHDFGAWDQANVLALVATLGTNVEAIAGLKAGGNRSGDLLRASGQAAYIKEGERWRLAETAATAAALPSAAGRGDVLLEFWRLARATARAVVFTPEAETVRDELIAARARIGRLEAALAVASGRQGGDGWGVIEAAARQRAQGGPPLINFSSQDNLESLRLLQLGRVTAAVLRNDEASLAANGGGPFERIGTFPELRALGSLYPEPVHVLAMAAAGLASVNDLYGKRVGVADTGPAALTEAIEVLRAHRIGTSALAIPLEARPVEQVLSALEKGNLDAVVMVAAAPARKLSVFADAHSTRFLAMDSDAIAVLTAGGATYLAATLPPRSYAQQPRPVATIAVTAQLVALATTPKRDVDALLGLIFAETDYPRLGSAAGALIGRRTAAAGLTIPFHQAAESYFAAPGG